MLVQPVVTGQAATAAAQSATGPSTATRPAENFAMPQPHQGMVSAKLGAVDPAPGAQPPAQSLSALAQQRGTGSLTDFVEQKFRAQADTRVEFDKLLRDIEGGKLNGMTPETMARFMKVQMGLQDAGMKLELVSKTLEMGTNGVNTLSRTQT